MFNTFGVHDWSVYLDDPSVGGVTAGERTKFLNINPAHPFIYIESKDSLSIKKMIVAAANKGSMGVVCLDHYCYIKSDNKCKDFPEKQKKAAYDIKLKVNGM
jgi:hypothetical protein